jgi:hypothetical protein
LGRCGRGDLEKDINHCIIFSGGEAVLTIFSTSIMEAVTEPARPSLSYQPPLCPAGSWGSCNVPQAIPLVDSSPKEIYQKPESPNEPNMRGQHDSGLWSVCLMGSGKSFARAQQFEDTQDNHGRNIHCIIERRLLAVSKAKAVLYLRGLFAIRGSPPVETHSLCHKHVG